MPARISVPLAAAHREKQPKARSGSRARPEEILQRQVAAFINSAYPTLLFWHCPNGGGRSRAEAGVLKAMGTLAGVPDITVILPCGLAAFLELKAPHGALSPAQKAFRDRARGFGCLWAEARSLTDAAETLEGWLLPFGWKARARVSA